MFWKLRKLASNSRNWAEQRFFPKRYNVRFTDQCWDPYFNDAEAAMDGQWANAIWPAIEGSNFDSVLELAPGAGRNTAKLVTIAQKLYAVDLNEAAIDRLKKRFEHYSGPCDLNIYKNDGTSLLMIPDASITFVYCWDAAVHFDRTVLRDYLKEFQRVMRAGATGFIHHSDLGDKASVDIRKNPHWRSNMSKDLFARYTREARLEIVKQISSPWKPIVDCISVIRKPGE
jgi:ubiquinone/menaquinone biosynthesis C-methylase UbiE